MTEVVNEKESLLNNVDKPDISLNVCQPVKKKKKKRCFHCKAKLPIINYPCKCGYVFCYQHLNAHSHNCTYDYSKERKEEWHYCKEYQTTSFFYRECTPM